MLIQRTRGRSDALLTPMAVPTTFSSNSRRVFREEKSFHLDDDKGRPHEPVLNHPPRHRRRVWVSSAMQVVSLEEEELTAQRDAAVLIFKELQKKVRIAINVQNNPVK